jgi:hypothetical protein
MGRISGGTSLFFLAIAAKTLEHVVITVSGVRIRFLNILGSCGVGQPRFLENVKILFGNIEFPCPEIGLLIYGAKA